VGFPELPNLRLLNSPLRQTEESCEEFMLGSSCYPHGHHRGFAKRLMVLGREAENAVTIS